MSISRVGSVAALAVALVLVAMLMFGVGSSSYQVTGIFETAGQIVKGNQIQIGGKPVGKITKIALTEDNQVAITMKVDEAFAPLHQGTTAVIRATGMAGVANRYISISPGPSNAAEIADGGMLRADKTTAAVDLDQLFNTLDAKTRRGLQRVVQQFAQAYDGNGEAVSQGAKYLSPWLASSSKVTRELLADQETFKRFIVTTSRLVTALAERRSDLSQLVHNASVGAGAIGKENQALAEALGLLPSTLRQANTTFVNLRSALDDLDPLVRESRPAARKLEPFLRELRPLVRDGRPSFHDLRYIVRSPGENNDLTEAARDLPKLANLTDSAFANSIKALEQSQPVIDFARPYVPDATGWLKAFGLGAANYDANGHYSRVLPVTLNFKIQGGQYVPTTQSERLDQLQKHVIRRCPGGASQPATDGSSPFVEEPAADCDSTLTPPGP